MDDPWILIDDIERTEEVITPWEWDFIEDIRTRLEDSRELTERQMEKLQEIWEQRVNG